LSLKGQSRKHEVQTTTLWLSSFSSRKCEKLVQLLGLAVIFFCFMLQHQRGLFVSNLLLLLWSKWEKGMQNGFLSRCVLFKKKF
jgi:hypothetical protein